MMLNEDISNKFTSHKILKNCCGYQTLPHYSPQPVGVDVCPGVVLLEAVGVVLAYFG